MYIYIYIHTHMYTHNVLYLAMGTRDGRSAAPRALPS